MVQMIAAASVGVKRRDLPSSLDVRYHSWQGSVVVLWRDAGMEKKHGDESSGSFRSGPWSGVRNLADRRRADAGVGLSARGPAAAPALRSLLQRRPRGSRARPRRRKG